MIFLLPVQPVSLVFFFLLFWYRSRDFVAADSDTMNTVASIQGFPVICGAVKQCLNNICIIDLMGFCIQCKTQTNESEEVLTTKRSMGMGIEDRNDTRASSLH